MRPAFDVSRFRLMKAKGESMQTSIRSLLSRAVRSRVAGVAVALLAALGIVVQGLAAPTAAAVNPKIEVTKLTLTKVNSSEEPQEGQLYVNGLALLQFEWDASKAQVKEGDSFTITLPPEFKFHSTLERPMEYTQQGKKYSVGKCTIGGQTLTCAFGPEITSLVQAGNKDIHGTGKFQLGVVTHTTKETLPVTINSDKTVQVDLPGEGGIPKPSGGSYRPDMKLYKGYNGFMKEGDANAAWYFSFGGPRLQKALGVTFDGQTERTITFKDTLGAGMKCPLQLLYLHAIDSEENPSQSLRLDDGMEPGPTNTPGHGSFEVTGTCGEMAPDGTTPITFVAKGPFKDKTNYSIDYRVGFVGGKALPGTDYTNTVSVDGTKIKETKTTSFVAAGSVDVSMRQGEGTFSITKKIGSDYANQVAADVTFTVAFDYELPAGTTADNYPNWTPPANTLNADKRTGTATMEVKRGQTIGFPIPFPVGTMISNLREDPLTANPVLPDGYVWKEPKFTIGSTATTSLTIQDQVNTKVDLLNTVGAADNGFQVVKKASGAEGAAAKKFSFSYACTLPDNTTKNGQIANVPGDETPVPSPEKFPVGTTCKVTEDTTGAGIDGYTLDPAGHDTQSVTIGLGSEPTVTATFTNTYTRDTGRFSVTKTVAGDAGDKAPATYTFDYTCKADGKNPIEGTIVVGKGETKESGDIPVGYSCTVKERVDKGQDGTAFVEGYTLDVTTGAAVTITKGAVSKIDVTNTYTRDTGRFSVTKKVAGDAGDKAPDTYTFDYTCKADGEKTITGTIVVGKGETKESGDIPVGYSCTVKERVDKGQDGTAFVEGYTLDVTTGAAVTITPAAVSSIGVTTGAAVTITPAAVPNIDVTNTYTRDVGRFSVTKRVAGDAGDKAPDTYTFDYTCKADGKDTITGTIVVGKGASEKSGDIPVGYSCTVKERVDKGQDGTAFVEGYTLDVVASPDVTIAKGALPNIDVTNTYTLNKGTFSVKKVVEGATFTGADNTFTVQYTCTHGSVALTDEQKAGSLTLTGNGTAVTSPSLPFGTSCTIKEADGSAQRAGYAVATAYTAGQVTVGTATPSPEVTVTNKYAPLKGGFVISKTVDGDGAALAKDKEFIFDYACTPLTGAAQVKGTVIIKGGEIGAVTDVPVGSCSVSERDAAIDGASLNTVFTVDGSTDGVNNGTAVFNVKDGVTVQVAATNTYVLDRGSFSVAKKVVGGADSFTKDTFVFDYVCTDGTEGRLDVPGDGTAVEGPRVPTGTECTVTERAQTANRDGYTVTSELSDNGKVSISQKDAVVAVTATNTYTPVPKVPGKQLAKTGASNVAVVGVVGSLLVVVGGVLIALRRRRDDA